jgi:hypothetical protein
MTDQIKEDIAALERLLAEASAKTLAPVDVTIEAIRAMPAIRRTIAMLKAQVSQPSLRTAAISLVAQMDLIHSDPAYLGVWTLAQIHNGQYTGPTYKEELAALREALNAHADPAPSVKETEEELLDQEITEAQDAYDADQGSVEKHKRLVCLQEEKRRLSDVP